MGTSTVRWGALAAVLAVALAAPALAEPPSPACDACPPLSDERGSSLRLAPYAEQGFPADLERDRGTIGVRRAGLLGTAAFPVASRARLRLQFGAERAFVDLSDPDEVVAGNGRLLDDALSLRLEPRLDVFVGGDWTLSAGPILGSSGALGARFEDTLTYGGTAAVRFPLGGDRTMRVGASVETALEDTLSIFPVFEIGGLSTGGLSVEGRGTGVRASLPLSPRFDVGAAARYDRRDWRLAEDDRVPGGVFRDIRVAVGLDLEWKPSRCVVLAVAAWWTVYHEVRVDERDGDRVTAFEADGSWMVSLGASVLF
jgi:hypothetical protein